ncbi:MAG: hypothetical protein J0I48_19160 [Devosia sp.]|uniref:GcrA family cell cycle regulator n=1 Tax=Devosia sp. 66-22 TaxID=1895753 RepID=UPI000926811C|nr:GcrA family cell cycle regulator [Devosia sp. 66-22]MBN9348286.1 hypothetical protein [Devosia sp.]OJX48973.1 MAG: hypothetical protein BGO81_10285 [Devosia sp. 66-22]
MDATHPVEDVWLLMDRKARYDRVKQLAHEDQMSASQIAAAIPGASRNAVIGVIHRSKGQIKLYRRPDREARLLARATSRVRGRNVKGSPDRQVTIVRVSPQTEQELFNAPAWQPLPGSEPKPLMDRAERGCRWPVTVGGKSLFCNCHVERRPDGLAYCDDHYAIYRSPAP